jgi:hypothetical protein
VADEPEIKEREFPYSLKLAYPIEFAGDPIGSLLFRRGKLADIKGLKIDTTPTADQLMLLASRMCGQPIKVIEMLDADDAGEVIEIALSFFIRCLGAGKTP